MPDRIGNRAAGVLAAIALLGCAVAASAQPGGYGYGYAPPPPPPHYETPYNQTPGLDQRQAQQRDWLRQGIASGRITRHEADRIRHALWELEQHERAAKADGIVTPPERRALREHAERVDALISRHFHDDQVRPPMYGELWR